MFSLPLTTWNVHDGSTLMSWKCRKSTAPPSTIRESGTRSATDSSNSTSWFARTLRSAATSGSDFDDIHFALRVESYRDTLTWLSGKGFRDDLPDGDFRKMKLRSKSVAGYAQIYIMDPDRNIIEFKLRDGGLRTPNLPIVRKTNLGSVCFRLL